MHTKDETKTTILLGRAVLTGEGLLFDHGVVFRDGVIERVAPVSDLINESGHVLDLPGLPAPRGTTSAHGGGFLHLRSFRRRSRAAARSAPAAAVAPAGGPSSRRSGRFTRVTRAA